MFDGEAKPWLDFDARGRKFSVPGHLKGYPDVGCSDDGARRENFALATQTPLAHNAVMAENHEFTINVAKDVDRPGRYRWNISENMKLRDKSLYSFATRREAQADADKFVQRLNAIWRSPR